MADEGLNIFIGTGIFFMAFVIVISLMTPFKDFITQTRDSSHLNCSGTGITTGTRMVCIIVDSTFPYWALMTLGAGFAFMFGKNKTQNVQ
jgi:hypothetical protein